MTDISLIITNYNREKYVSRAISSVKSISKWY